MHARAPVFRLTAVLLAGIVAAAFAGLFTGGLAAAGPAGGELLLVVNKNDSTLSIFDVSEGPAPDEAVAVVPVGFGPHEVTVGADGRYAWVSDYGNGPRPGNTLTVVDLRTFKKTATVDLGEHTRPHGLWTLPDGDILVTCEGSRHLVTVDADTREVVQAVPTRADVSHMVAVTPDGALAFTANIGSGDVTVVDLAKGEVVTTIATGAGCEAIDVSPDGTRVWAGNRAADTLTVIDVESLEVVDQVACASFPIRLKFTPDGRHVLVSCARSGEVAVIDADTHAETARIPTGALPIGLLIAPDGRRAWVANTRGDRITVLDLEAGEAVGVLQAGRTPDGLALTPAPKAPDGDEPDGNRRDF